VTEGGGGQKVLKKCHIIIFEWPYTYNTPQQGLSTYTHYNDVNENLPGDLAQLIINT